MDMQEKNIQNVTTRISRNKQKQYDFHNRPMSLFENTQPLRKESPSKEKESGDDFMRTSRSEYNHE